MQATFDTIVTVGDKPMVLDRHGFMLYYTNIGPRPITVTGHSWRLPFQRRQLVFTPQYEPGTAHLHSKLPVEITDGKSGHVFYKQNFFSELEQPEMALLDRPEFHRHSVAALRVALFELYR